MKHKLFNFDYQTFKEKLKRINPEIDDQQLELICCSIKNNLFALVDSHYNDVLYNYICEKTSIATCLQIKQILNNYLRFELNS